MNYLTVDKNTIVKTTQFLNCVLLDGEMMALHVLKRITELNIPYRQTIIDHRMDSSTIEYWDNREITRKELRKILTKKGILNFEYKLLKVDRMGFIEEIHPSKFIYRGVATQLFGSNRENFFIGNEVRLGDLIATHENFSAIAEIKTLDCKKYKEFPGYRSALKNFKDELEILEARNINKTTKKISL